MVLPKPSTLCQSCNRRRCQLCVSRLHVIDVQRAAHCSTLCLHQLLATDEGEHGCRPLVWAVHLDSYVYNVSWSLVWKHHLCAGSPFRLGVTFLQSERVSCESRSHVMRVVEPGKHAKLLETLVQAVTSVSTINLSCGTCLRRSSSHGNVSWVREPGAHVFTRPLCALSRALLAHKAAARHASGYVLLCKLG